LATCTSFEMVQRDTQSISNMIISAHFALLYILGFQKLKQLNRQIISNQIFPENATNFQVSLI